MKVAYNTSYGSFSLSPKELDRYRELSGLKGYLSSYDFTRHDKHLIQVVEETIKDHGYRSSLAVIEIFPADSYYIEEYDGLETVWTPLTIPWIKTDETNTKAY